MRPLFVPDSVKNFDKNPKELKEYLPVIAENFERLYVKEPDVSIIIPAFNEEENILKTLYSLSFTNTKKKVEVIVVNNNSSDNTYSLAKAANVICINEPKQGITNARNAGLSVANGRYILNADADTIYPESWIDNMINPLIINKNVALTYGRFSFIPISNTSRLLYFIYEHLADFNKFINRKLKEEAVNVYGFNSACRRHQCLNVNGFDHPLGTNEDGWLAIKLRENGCGSLVNVRNKESIVWTTDRRILMDGGIIRASFKRILKNIRK
jgi:glycosyltransferase involved in cell wall biosynthesis